MDNENNNNDNDNNVNNKTSNKVVLKFVPISSTVESSFWLQYGEEKLNKIKLGEAPISMRGTLEHPGRLRLTQASLMESASTTTTATTTAAITTTTTTTTSQRVPVLLQGLNTLERFKTLDKNQLLRDVFLEQFLPKDTHDNDDDDDRMKEEVSFCNSTLGFCLAFMDLKKHTVVYWFAFPALVPRHPIQCQLVTKLSEIWSLQECQQLQEAHKNLVIQVQQQQQQRRQQKQKQQQQQQQQQQDDENSASVNWPNYFLVLRDCSTDNGDDATRTAVKCLPFSKKLYEQHKMEEKKGKTDVMIGFVDYSSSSSPPTTTTTTTSGTAVANMGWSLRNLVALLSIHWDLGNHDEISILSFRSSNNYSMHGQKQQHQQQQQNCESLVLQNVEIPPKEDYLYSAEGTSTTTATTTNVNDNYYYKVVGWELNARGKPGPRMVNLKPLLDSTHLAIQAADLNLKLMKWRMLPELNVDLLQSTKILLLGAGTLGCSVARTLLGWGIRDFTFVDNGKVRYSNPVRQSLFTLKDCESETNKAEAAANALKEIAPNAQSRGVVLSIPMPGHVESDAKTLAETVEKLDGLIQEHDVVFLLTDTRESRWLPTVMCAAHDKPLMNAALGLDSWLVIRHGGGFSKSSSRSSSDNSGRTTGAATAVTGTSSSSDAIRSQEQRGADDRLGCYFCNDVVAPENSTKNRTLDQQCTVTRPGLAPIASSMASELIIALLHHDKRHHAPAPLRNNRQSVFGMVDEESSSSSFSSSAAAALGFMPHQIRGSLVSYSIMTPTVHAFPYCTGCCFAVVQEYLEKRSEFVYKVCNCSNEQGREVVVGGGSSSYLEDLTGLTKFREEAAQKMEQAVEDWDEDDDDQDDF